MIPAEHERQVEAVLPTEPAPHREIAARLDCWSPAYVRAVLDRLTKQRRARSQLAVNKRRQPVRLYARPQ